MKKNAKEGISLIVLVITIIVIVIITTAIILNITNTGAIDSAKKAKFMSDYRSVEDGVSLYSVSNIDMLNANTFKLPLDSKLSLTDKQEIINKVPTLKTKIEELNAGKTIDDMDLYWINEDQAGVSGLASNKKDKGYIIDVATKQVYDYVGDTFEGKRWHTLDGGVVDTLVNEVIQETVEMWDGWIKLTLFYPNSSTEKKWRLGAEGELRFDPMLMWQDYTGSITVPLDKVKDVWIKYKIAGKEVVIPPAGKLLVDIEPDKTGSTIVTQVNVKINYDESATVKEYRIGESGWITYTGAFDVTENCIIEARAKKTENIYNTDGTLLLARDIAGTDMVYIGNIGIVEAPLAAPTITRLDPVAGDEKARVQVTYPANAVKKVFKINYGIEENYTSEISIKNWGTHIIAYYYDASGKKSQATAIYVNDTSTGEGEKPAKPFTPEPPIPPGGTPPPSGLNPTNLVAPTITRLAAISGDEKARVKVDYPVQAVTKIYTENYGVEQNYTSEISVKNFGSFIIAYYYDANGNKSPASKIYINDTSGGGVESPPEAFPPITNAPRENVPLPVININPSTGLVPQVTVSVSVPGNADKTYIKIGRYGEYQDYTAPIVVRDNEEIYAYYTTHIGNKSTIANARITNIQKPAGGDPASGKVKPYVYIEANPYPWSGSHNVSEVTISIRNSDCTTLEYSEDGVIYKPYTGSFVVKENERIYARGTNSNGVTEDYLDITNIGKITPPKVIQNLLVSINVNPEPDLAITRVAKVKVNIEYDSKATEKLYRIGSTGELKTYAGEFEVDKNCTIYAYAKATDALGQTAKSIDNIVDGISEPIISPSPRSNIQASKISVSIQYDKYASIKRYSIDGGTLRDYTGAFDVTKNGTVIYAYSENAKGQKSDASYTIQNIIPEPPVLLLDKGNYYLLKLSYPQGSAGQEYKWKVDGQWKGYKEDGILLIKPQFKDQLLQGGTLVKIEDENGKMIDFKGDYYLIDVQISELFENLFMRWDRIAPPAPQIIVSPTDPAKQVTATIVYSDLLVKKQYRIVKPGETPGDFQDYTGPITIDTNNTTIYAKGMDDTEVWSSVGMSKVTNIDEVPPVIKLTADLSTAQQSVAVKINVTDDIAVGKVKWAPGTLGESYFETSGTEIPNDSIVNITSNGYYTFYGEDKVGNKQVYTLNITNVDLTPPVIDIAVSPENTVGLTSNVTINYGDSTIKQYKVGTSNSTWNNYTNTFTISSNTVLANNWQNADGTVTIYAKGKDSAGNEVIVQKKILSLDLDKPTAPVINCNAGYPILSAYGVKYDGTTTITYDSRTDIDNYYSTDNGATWKVYTGQFNMVTGTIIAKSVKKNTGLDVSTSYTIAVPADALGKEAYDNNDSTYYVGANKYMKVDPDIVGKNIRVKAYTYGTNNLAFQDENRVEIGRVTLGWDYTDTSYTIPTNTKWLKYIGHISYDWCRIYEIAPSNNPKFTAKNGYMLLSADPTKAIKKPYQMVSISYFPTSVQRLYKIGTTGQWLNYNDQPVKVDQAQTIYAKGIDQYGTETLITSSYTVNVTDALTVEVYDNNDSTYLVGTNKYMEIDANMQGKSVRVKAYSYAGNSLIFLDANMIQVGSIDTWYDTDKVSIVPQNAKFIKYVGHTDYNWARLYEIAPSNEPTFTSTNGYMVLNADPTKAIREPYQMVSISYFDTSVQKLYRIGATGNWLNYIDQPIKVNQGQTIYAKGIDQYGIETRVISSYTPDVADALKKEVYDGNPSTYVYGKLSQYMQVDSSMQGKNITLNLVATGYGNLIYIRFLDQNKNEISVTEYRNGATATAPLTIPQNTKWIKYESPLYSDNYLYEIGIANEPVISASNGNYMLLTANSADAIRKPYKMITVSYFPTSVQKLYRIGTTGDWLNYTVPVKVDQDQTIYVKGIDAYGNETRLTPSYTVNVPDALKGAAYDENFDNYTTYYSGYNINQYMSVDSSMQGKNVRIKTYNHVSDKIYFLDVSNNIISTISLGTGYIDTTYLIPMGTKTINYYPTGLYSQFHDIQPVS